MMPRYYAFDAITSLFRVDIAAYALPFARCSCYATPLFFFFFADVAMLRHSGFDSVCFSRFTPRCLLILHAACFIISPYHAMH